MMEDMGKSELTPMVAVDPFHLPQSEPLALTVNTKEKGSRQEEEEKEEEVNFKRLDEKKPGFTFTVSDDNGENQSFTLQVPTSISHSLKVLWHGAQFIICLTVVIVSNRFLLNLISC